MSQEKNIILLGGDSRLTIEDLNKVARENVKAALHKKSEFLMNKSHEVLQKYSSDRVPVYGLNTQFGSQVNILDANITNNEKRYNHSLGERQLRLIKSHNCGLGEEMPQEATRAAMLLRAHCLSLGYSGVRPASARALVDFLNNDIHPVIRRYGSIGASGDLIPLSAVAAALIGEKTPVFYRGKKMDAPLALKLAGLKKFIPEGREGLALINGTSFMTGVAALAAYDLQRLFFQTLSAIAMSLEAMKIIGGAYNPMVHELKRHKGSIEINDFLNEFWKGNKLIQDLADVREATAQFVKYNGHTASAEQGIQDYYSLRSVPQGFGTFYENLNRATKWIEDEMNSVNDNPIVDADKNKIYQGANFMGYYVTESCDILKMDIAQASTWLHAILANLIHPRKNAGLPANLVPHPEINNGFRPIQILAASLAVQNRKLAQSQQAFMIPTEGDNQDVNSLAAHAAYDFTESVRNLERLTAIMFLASAQALELRRADKAGKRAWHILSSIRKTSPFLDADRSLSGDIEAVIKLMKEDKI